MESTLQPTHGRKQLQYFPYYYGYSNHRWLYWAIPIIAVGIFVFIVAMVIFVTKRRRQARWNRQNHIAQYSQPAPVPAAAAPVTGYPDYSAQYNNEYATYSSMPAAGRPTPEAPHQQPPYNTPGYKPNDVEMGYPQRF